MSDVINMSLLMGPEFLVKVVQESPVTEFQLVVGTRSGGKKFPLPDNFDETDELYFFFGWEEILGGWLIHRQVRLSSLTIRADVANNVTVPDLATAWPSRATLAYS